MFHLKSTSVDNSAWIAFLTLNEVKSRLLILAPFPDPQRPAEGVAARVLSMDSVFSGIPRIYLHPDRSHRGNPIIREQSKEITVYQCHPVRHLLLIRKLASETSLIYCHTSYFSAHVFHILFRRRFILDLHGIVPEEAHLVGRHVTAIFWRQFERMLLPAAWKIVTVTESMSRHVVATYGKSLFERTLVIPIFDKESGTKITPIDWEAKDPKTVIYAGGWHKWQNISLMLRTARELKDRFRFVFVLSGLDGFRSAFKSELTGLEDDGVQFLTLPKHSLFERYRRASFGLLLRTDDPVNRVACPTKLIEYMHFQIVPVLCSTRVGDFGEDPFFGYLSYADFLSGTVPSSNNRKVLTQNNLIVLEKMEKRARQARQALRGMVEECCRTVTSTSI
jgi:glycosyltransferase involved in cell wall biosynthesis